VKGNEHKEAKKAKAKPKDANKPKGAKKKSASDGPDLSLKGVDVRTLHEAYQLLMKKYCPDKAGKKDDNESCADAGNVGMMGF